MAADAKYRTTPALCAKNAQAEEAGAIAARQWMDGHRDPLAEVLERILECVPIGARNAYQTGFLTAIDREISRPSTDDTTDPRQSPPALGPAVPDLLRRALVDFADHALLKIAGRTPAARRVIKRLYVIATQIERDEPGLCLDAEILDLIRDRRAIVRTDREEHPPFRPFRIQLVAVQAAFATTEPPHNA